MSVVVRSDLAACEEVIERGLGTFVQVGEALLRIRDDRLYREQHGTFEDYCRERWGLKRQRAYELIDAAATVTTVSEISDTPAPRTESHAAELAPLRDEPEELVEAWTEAVRAAEADDQPVTAERVKAAVKARQPAKSSTSAYDPMLALDTDRKVALGDTNARRVWTVTNALDGLTDGLPSAKLRYASAALSANDLITAAQEIASSLDDLRKFAGELRKAGEAKAAREEEGAS